MDNLKINYEEAWFNLLDELKALCSETGDLEIEPYHSAFHYILDEIVPTVLEKQIGPKWES